VVRGGAWPFPALYCRSATRLGVLPDHASDVVGFRVVCDIAAK
jgi:formylglycine-generating enzyme required for sulfatase activity